MSQQSSDGPVLFDTIASACGKSIGVITLNVEKTLNSLTLDMVKMMLEQLSIWKVDDQIVCLLIKAAGEKAFCAGGDVQALYKSATQNPGGPCEYAETFFKREYELDYALHRYPKPIIG